MYYLSIQIDLSPIYPLFPNANFEQGTSEQVVLPNNLCHERCLYLGTYLLIHLDPQVVQALNDLLQDHLVCDLDQRHL